MSKRGGKRMVIDDHDQEDSPVPSKTKKIAKNKGAQGKPKMSKFAEILRSAYIQALQASEAFDEDDIGNAVNVLMEISMAKEQLVELLREVFQNQSLTAQQSAKWNAGVQAGAQVDTIQMNVGKFVAALAKGQVFTINIPVVQDLSKKSNVPGIVQVIPTKNRSIEKVALKGCGQATCMKTSSTSFCAACVANYRTMLGNALVEKFNNTNIYTKQPWVSYAKINPEKVQAQRDARKEKILSLIGLIDAPIWIKSQTAYSRTVVSVTLNSTDLRNKNKAQEDKQASITFRFWFNDEGRPVLMPKQHLLLYSNDIGQVFVNWLGIGVQSLIVGSNGMIGTSQRQPVRQKSGGVQESKVEESVKKNLMF